MVIEPFWSVTLNQPKRPKNELWNKQVQLTTLLVTYCWWQPEIRRSPAEVGSVSHCLQGFSTIPSGAGFLNHQQYLCGGFKYFFYLFSSRMLGKIPVLTHMFHMGWNHQSGIESRISMWFLLLKLIVISLGWRLIRMHRHSGTLDHLPLSHHPLG